MSSKKSAEPNSASKMPKKPLTKSAPAKKAGKSKKTAQSKTGKPAAEKVMGRPSAFTDEVKSKIIVAIGAGNSLSTAAEYASISRETLRLWMKKGEAGEPEFFGFFGSLKKAQADAEAQSVARIRMAAKGGAVLERTSVTTERVGKNGITTTTTRSTERYAPPQWQADAWWLERVNRQQWGRHDRVTNTNYNFDLESLSDEQFELFDQLTREGVEPPIAYATCLGKKD